ncbi:phage minor head protein [Desulfovibrio sp. QI0442]
MTPIIDEIFKQQHRAEGRANALVDEIIEALTAALENLTAQVVALRVRFLSARPWEQESLQRKKGFLEAQRKAVEKAINEVYESKASALLTATQDTMTYVQAETASLGLANRLAFEVGSLHLDLDTVTAWAQVTTIEGLTMTEWLKRMARHTADKIVQAGRESIIQGLTVRQMAKLLRQRGVENSRPAIESLARTYLISASNYAREQAMEVLGADLDFKWQYVATLDGRTCIMCGVDDGKIYKKDDKRPSLPRHINCRCTYIPVFDETLDDATRPAVKHNERTVQHRDGSTSTKFTIDRVDHVPAQETYSQWMERQLKEDPAFVQQVLGKTRFELFQKGELTLKKMVVDGRIKTLSGM